MGGKYEVRIRDTEGHNNVSDHYFQSWVPFIWFRIKNRSSILYIKIYY